VSATSTSGVSLALYQGSIASSGRLSTSTRAGGTTSLSFRNRGAGHEAYLVVTPARGTRSSDYTASLSAK
jgi:hypothetical protein